jgi:phage/plasmid-like protein (TIGR03299 family)
MAHEIHIRASGKAEMAYVGETPWHGLGQSVTKGATIETWQREAGLDWTALRSTAKYYDASGVLLSYPEKNVIFRSDSSEPIGMVSDKYIVVQPKDVLESFRRLQDSGEWNIHTAGSLHGGSKVWAMATAEGLDGAIGKNGVDRIKGNLLLVTSLDGTLRTRALLTAVRVVCANTLRLALSGATEVSVSHRSYFDADEMFSSLGVAVHSFGEFVGQAAALAEESIGMAQARDVLRELFGQPTVKPIAPTAPDFEFQRMMAQFSAAAGEGREREQRSVARTLELFKGLGIGSELSTAKGTKWGLLNAVTQHVDHEWGRSADTRMESAWLGRGNEVKTKALELLTV